MRMLARSALLLAAVVALAGTAVAAPHAIGGPIDTPSRPAARLTQQAPTLVIGDSALAALEWAPGAKRAVIAYDITFDLKACRRLYRPSCASPAPTTAYQAVGARGRSFETVIVAVGYNDVASVTAEGFQAVVSRAREFGATRIMWFTLRDFGSFRDRNQIVRDLLATGQYPDVVLADWGAYTAGRPDWFVGDGVHFRVIGAWAAADYLTRKLAFLDSRVCPMPTAPGVPASDPCPDPDVTGPVADLAALYDMPGV